MSAPDEGPWYLQRGKNRAIGPFTRAEIVEGIESGEIPPDSKVCEVDGKQWLPLEAIASLRAVLVATGKLPKIVDSKPPPAPLPEPKPRAPRPERPPRESRALPVSSNARNVVRAIGVLGIVVAITRLVLLIAPPTALRALFDTLHALRVEHALATGLGVVAWSTFVGAAKERQVRASLQVAIVSIVASDAIAMLSLSSVVRSPRFALLTSTTQRMVVGAIAVPALSSIAALAIAVVALRVRPRELVTFTRASLVPVACGLAAAPLAAFVAFVVAARTDVRTLGARSVVPFPVFVADRDLADWIEGTRAGSEGVEAFERALRNALIVTPGTRGRFVADRRVETARGPADAEELELLTGEHSGRRVLVAVPSISAGGP